MTSIRQRIFFSSCMIRYSISIVEVHDVHCGAVGRRAVVATFAWFEALRLLNCARRFSACSAPMATLLEAECHRVDVGLEELQRHMNMIVIICCLCVFVSEEFQTYIDRLNATNIDSIIVVLYRSIKPTVNSRVVFFPIDNNNSYDDTHRCGP